MISYVLITINFTMPGSFRSSSLVVLLSSGFSRAFIVAKAKPAGLHGAVQTLSVGALAARISYGIVYGIGHSNLHGYRLV